MASLRDIFNNRIKKPISSLLQQSAKGYGIGFNKLNTILNPPQVQARRQQMLAPVTNFAQSFGSTFAKAPQQLGQGIGTAVIAPYNYLLNKANQNTTNRLSNTLRSRSTRQLQAGDINSSRNTANLLADLQQRQAKSQIGFGQDIKQARQNVIGGGVKTGLQLYGAGAGAKPILASMGISGLLSGGLNKAAGGSFATGAGSGTAEGLAYAGINRLTTPYISKLAQGIGGTTGQLSKILTTGGKARPKELYLAEKLGRVLGSAVGQGVGNLAENQAYTRLTENRAPTMGENIASFAIPSVIDVLTNGSAIIGKDRYIRNKAGQMYDPINGLWVKASKKVEALQNKMFESVTGNPVNRNTVLTEMPPTENNMLGGMRREPKGRSRLVNDPSGGFVDPSGFGKQPSVPNSKSNRLPSEVAPSGEKATTTPAAASRQFLESLGEPTSSRNVQPDISSDTILPQSRKVALESFGRDPNLTENKKLTDLFNDGSTPSKILVDEETKAASLGNLLDENARVNTEVKNTFGDWVKARQASRVQDSIKKRQFSQFDDEGLNGINRFQSGEKAGLEPVTKYFNDKFSELQKAGVKFNYQEDYVPQLWKNSPQEVSDVLGKRLGLKPSFTLDKVIEDYKTGIELGLTPRFTKLSELVGWYEGRANKALADTQFFNTLVKDELIKPSSQAKGWVTLDPDRFPKFRSGYENTEYQGTYSAPKELADLVNNYLKTPEGTVANIANYASKVKNTLLSAGVIYPTIENGKLTLKGTGLNAHGLNILARNTMASNNPIGGFLRGTQYLVNPKSADKYINANLEKVEFAAKSGVTFNIEDHNFGDIEEKIIKENQNVLSKVWSAAMERREKLFDKPLFEKAIPALKVQYFDNLYTSLKKEVNEKDAARTASEITNNIFGGINSEAMGRSRETQNIFRSLILAPDWAETQLRLGKNIPKSILDFKNPAGKAYRTFARNMVLAFTAMAAANKATSGHYPWENEAGHTFEIEAGTTEDGKKRYIRPFGTAMDFVRLPYDVALSVAKGDVSSIGRVVRNRLSVPLSNVAEVVTNVDYRGRKVFGSDVPAQQQLGSVASMVSESVGVPSQVSSIIGGLTGKTGAEETLTNLTELPLRYTGGASSKTQKYVQDILKNSSLSGQEKYDLYAKLKGQTLGDKQKRAIELGGKSALDTILKQKELNKKQNDLRKKYSGEEEEKGLLEDLFSVLQAKKVGAADNPTDTTTSNALKAGVPTTTPASPRGGLRGIFDKLTGGNQPAPEVVPTIKPGELKNLSKFESDDIKLRQEFGEPVTNDELTSYYLGAIPSAKSGSAYDTTVRQKSLFKALDKVEGDDMLSEEQRQVVRDRIAKETGLQQEDLDYYQVAQQDTDLKYQRVLDDVASLESKDALFKYLSEGRKVVNGKLVVSDDVISQLYEDGYLEKDERAYLQALRWNQKQGKVFLDRDFKVKGSGGGTGKKKTAALFNAIEGVQKAQGQLRTSSILQPISLGKSNFETVLSQSRASSPGKSGRSLESIFSQLESSKKKLRNLKVST